MTLADALQIALSLIAVLALAGVARWMDLGGDPRIRDDDAARALAAQCVPGFRAAAVARDKAGIAALLRDADGRQMLLKRHGSAFVGRLLDSHVDARLDQTFLTIGTGERLFEPVTLNLGDQAQYWASGLRHLPNG